MQLRLAFLFLSIFHLPLNSDGYSILFMQSEDSTASPIFSIVRVEPSGNGLRLFLETDRPDEVAVLADGGALEAQLSDHQAERTESLSILFGKAVRCTAESDPVYLSYSEPLPGCDGQPPAIVQYFFEVTVSLGPNRDLAISHEPDFMWLIEESGMSTGICAPDGEAYGK
jgi:hypothetical protein